MGSVISLTSGHAPYTVTIELEGDVLPWQLGDEVELLAADNDESARLDEAHERGYIAGAAAQWWAIVRQGVRELRSYGVGVEYREVGRDG